MESSLEEVVPTVISAFDWVSLLVGIASLIVGIISLIMVGSINNALTKQRDTHIIKEKNPDRIKHLNEALEAVQTCKSVTELREIVFEDSLYSELCDIDGDKIYSGEDQKIISDAKKAAEAICTLGNTHFDNYRLKIIDCIRKVIHILERVNY